MQHEKNTVHHSVKLNRNYCALHFNAAAVKGQANYAMYWWVAYEITPRISEV